jgi:hypothetical protein
MRRSYGSVFRVPEQKPGAMATCAFCPWSRFYETSKRKTGNAVSRAKRALDGHIRKVHTRRAVEWGVLIPICGKSA